MISEDTARYKNLAEFTLPSLVETYQLFWGLSCGYTFFSGITSGSGSSSFLFFFHFFLMKERLSLISSREAPVFWCRVFEGSPVTEHSTLSCVSPASTSMDSVFVVVFLMIWIPCRGIFHYWEMTYCLSFLPSAFSRERTWEVWSGLSQRKWSWGSGVRGDAGEEGRRASLLGICLVVHALDWPLVAWKGTLQLPELPVLKS